MNKTLIEGIDFYYDENNYVVFTEKYHIEKGYCCGLGCRHCTYNYENVPEPKRSELLKNIQTTSTNN
ncbi:MAG: hypothetical protein JST29_12665 [Bacteroidetes bacterium]|nr:hypothetical protein [Bacteroidota bacterium]MBS1590867.1 hypothetical protein [Bacteroidota bacterium]